MRKDANSAISLTRVQLWLGHRSFGGSYQFFVDKCRHIGLHFTLYQDGFSGLVDLSKPAVHAVDTVKDTCMAREERTERDKNYHHHTEHCCKDLETYTLKQLEIMKQDENTVWKRNVREEKE